MAWSCLRIIQTACRRIGILAPNAAVTSTDQQIIQIVAICEEEGQELAARYSWQALQTEATFTTLAAELQGAVSTIAPGLGYILNDTIYNRTLQRPVYGPSSPQKWQADKASQLTGPWSSFRVKGDALYFYPAPEAGDSCYFEYASRNWVSTSAGSASDTWTNDADTPLLDDQLLTLGTIWRWKQAKGLDYAEDFAKYERRAADLMGRDAGKPTLRMDGSADDVRPFVVVPAGPWAIP